MLYELLYMLEIIRSLKSLHINHENLPIPLRIHIRFWPNTFYFPLFESYMIFQGRVIKEYQVKVYFIDVSKLSDTENSKLNAKISYGNATPMTVFIENGKEKSSYNRIRGDQDRDVIVSMFQKNGYIEE